MAYQFHSWARKSIANQIKTPDYLGKGTVPPDLSVKVPLTIQAGGVDVDKTFSIAGPGDVIGIHQDMIVRTDPRPNSGDFEPNYFAGIEFYDEDFPWRYTPAAAVGTNNSRLRPWLMLIVLKESEFEKTKRNVPLHSILITDGSVLPPADELYLWAHVHSNFGEENTPLDDVFESLRKKSETDPDGLYSRIICPRKLDPDTLYQAFLVPVFECGRLAGLDLPNSEVPVQKSAWDESTMQVEMPVYYRWQFRTGANADFESLVKMMEARKDLDPRVGVRQLDVSNPGYIRTQGSGPVPALTPTIVGMFGAVKRLDASVEVLNNTQPFVVEVGNHLNLSVEEDPEKDPVVTIPFYGYHYAKIPSVMSPKFEAIKASWINQLNADPRNRSAAGLGTKVIQQHQENLMQSAWAQLSKISEINRMIRQFQMAAEVNERLLNSSVAKVKDAGKVMAIAGPALARMRDISPQKTVQQALTDSMVPNATVSSAFRRLARENGPISRELKRSGNFTFQRVFAKVNQPATVQQPPQQFDWVASLTGFKMNTNLPAAIPDIPAVAPNIKTAPVGPRPTVVTGVLRDGLSSSAATPRSSATTAPTGDIRAGSVEGRGDARAAAADARAAAAADARAAAAASRAIDNQIKSVFELNETIFAIKVDAPTSNTRITENYQGHIASRLHPVNTLLPALRAKIPGLPKSPAVQEEVLPVMAHPDFPEPSYKHLAAIDQDFILPNLDLIPPNTIALMQSNFTFIYSYLVGLNHEMGRELLWREYPTDQRGSYFRQFWDPGGLRLPDSPNPDNYKDVRPLPQWKDFELKNFGKIGYMKSGEPLILILKGELLKKYPNTIVYAQKAVMNSSNELVLDPADNMTKFKFPSFSGSLVPDVRLSGFDMTKKDAMGDGTAANRGWFFVIAEIPGEPRFGVDITYDKPDDGINSWNDLSLEQLNASSSFIMGKEFPANPSVGKWPTEKNSPDTIDVEKWGRSSADMAGILLQKPVMIAIHATQLLKDL